MKGGERRQLESRKRKHGTGKTAGSDPCQQIARRCRTTHAKRTQGTIWAVGETALPEAENSPVMIKKVGGDGVLCPEATGLFVLSTDLHGVRQVKLGIPGGVRVPVE